MGRIHPTAVISPGARIGVGCEIGPYAVIGPQVRLAAGNWVGPHVVIEGETDVGAGNRFLQFASVGAGPQVSGWAGEPGRLEIGEGNVFREFVTLHASTGGVTRLGSRNLLMAGAHVAHDCRLGDEVKLANGATLGGNVEVGDFAWISGLCAVHQGVRVGAHAFVAGGSIVTQDIPPFCLVQGDRARLVGLNLVGLRRAGFAPGEIAALRRAYRRLFLGEGLLAERIAAVRALDEPRATVLADFVAGSARGAISSLRRQSRLAA
ncbi:MAG: acyl-ACP--UDP-N-acetylglucosamine O-acyltransferase [Phenylobacterium sp.]|uniref:acyl-ACP--UDP-N-acetylglucosamine O-acyltransferase n=1 Tax=Phenylobacterium sp. TaxID=1871053 RepID=UPI003919CC95